VGRHPTAPFDFEGGRDLSHVCDASLVSSRRAGSTSQPGFCGCGICGHHYRGCTRVGQRARRKFLLGVDGIRSDRLLRQDVFVGSLLHRPRDRIVGGRMRGALDRSRDPAGTKSKLTRQLSLVLSGDIRGCWPGPRASSPAYAEAPAVRISVFRQRPQHHHRNWLRAEKHMLLEDDVDAAEGDQGNHEVRQEQEHPPQINGSPESNQSAVEGFKAIGDYRSPDSTDYQESCAHPRSRKGGHHSGSRSEKRHITTARWPQGRRLLGIRVLPGDVLGTVGAHLLPRMARWRSCPRTDSASLPEGSGQAVP
jgi:hypothetical protein